MKSCFRGVLIAGLVIVGLGGSMAALAMGEVLAAGVWRYKMTVTVETPEGIKIGSAVREISVRQNPKFTPETLPHIEVKGESVVVDLGARGTLFAIMKDANGPDYTHLIVYKTLGGGTSVEGVKSLMNATGKKAVLAPTDYPVMVTFKDINDPKSVALAYQAKPYNAMDENKLFIGVKYEITDRMEELFGAGVKLKEITIEMTDEKVTWGVEKYLPKSFSSVIVDGWRQLSLDERNRLSDLLYFKIGGQK